MLLAVLALLAMTPGDIMARTIAATRADTAAWHARITMLKHVTVDKNDKRDRDDVFLTYGDNDGSMEELRWHNGTRINGVPPEPVIIEIPRIITERAACYTFSLAQPATGTLNGRLVYVLTFTPRTPACHGSDGDEEHIALLTAGTVWIDQERFCIWKLEGHLSKPIVKRLLIVTLGSIDVCDLMFEQMAVGDLIVPSRLRTFVQYKSAIKGGGIEERNVTYDTPASKVP